MVLFASWCALRFGELTELRRGDIDPPLQGVIRVGTRRHPAAPGSITVGQPQV